MQTYYFDTSALVKLYHEESGTNEVEQIFSSEDSTFNRANIPTDSHPSGRVIGT